MFSTALVRKHVKKSVKNIVLLVITVQVILALLHLGGWINYGTEENQKGLHTKHHHHRKRVEKRDLSDELQLGKRKNNETRENDQDAHVKRRKKAAAHEQQKSIDLPPKVLRTNFISKSVEGNAAVRVLHDVCVMRSKDELTYRSKSNQTCTETKNNLYSYNQKSNDSVSLPQSLPRVRFRTTHPPRNFTYDSRDVLIVETRYFDNMNHFWREFIYPLSYILSSNKGKQRPLLLFTEPPYYHKCVFPNRKNYTTWFDTFHPMLPVDLPPADLYEWYTYHTLPHGTCFNTAVFVDLPRFHYKPKPSLVTNVAKKVQNFLNATDKVCHDTDVVTLIARSGQREIVNQDELQSAAADMGYNFKAVSMETLTVREQVQTVLCSKVLIGVSGAGLTWAMMLKQGSSLIEIAWPQQGWPFRYATDEMTSMWPHVKLLQLEALEILPNYEETVLQMVIPNLPQKVKDLMVTEIRDIYEAGSQLVDAIVWKRKPAGRYSLSLQEFRIFVENSKTDPMMEELKFLVKKAMAERHTVRTEKLAEVLVGKASTATKDLRKISQFLNDISQVLKKVGKKFQARVSVTEFIQVLQKALPPPSNKKS